MPVSQYILDLRAVIGHRLLLLPAVAAVIHDPSGRVLVVRTRTGWSLPAGAVEPGEDPRAAIVREVLEETGLSVAPSRLLDIVGGVAFRVRYPNGDLVEYTASVFGCDIVGGEPRPDGDETTELKWVQPEEVAPLLDLPYAPSLFARPR